LRWGATTELSASKSGSHSVRLSAVSVPSLVYRPLCDLSAALAAGEVSAVELTEAVIARTAAVEPRVRAFNSRDEEDARRQAAAADARRARRESRGPLDGIPIGVKDVIAVKDQPLTASSRMLANYVSPYDATVIERLRQAGVVLWGRLNLDEFAMGSSTENSATTPTANPYDLTRVPGGSSGGSAAAVAAGEVIAALGSDTGGSIRQPAAFCNVVGLKPTYGLVSRYGLAAFASSLDQIGPMTRTVEDTALLLAALAGHDERDSTSLRVEIPDYRAQLQKRRGPWRIGLPREYFGEGVDPEVRSAVERVAEFYRAQGCTLTELSLPYTEHGLSVYYILAPAEASSNLARYDGVRYGHRAASPANMLDLYARSRAEGFGAEVKRRIILGTYVLSSGYYDAYYRRAQQVRTLIREDFLRALREVDVLLTPTTPTPAFPRGEKAADPLQMYLADVFTIGVNLAGLPGISVPAGFSAGGLPLGFQLIGRPCDEAELLAVAHAYDREHPWSRRLPEL
jgi:aspartyl-tRNA(Asn)/glutamyl-tRNA(Gln) amidotransferase subunit A